MVCSPRDSLQVGFNQKTVAFRYVGAATESDTSLVTSYRHEMCENKRNTR